MDKNPDISFLCKLGQIGIYMQGNHQRCDGRAYGPALTDPTRICTCKCHGWEPKDGE